jgi:two-component system response regulator RegA
MKNLLILDDDILFRKSLIDNLVYFFDNIIESESISDARKKISTNESINYYLIDLNLPDGNGLQLIKELYDSSPKVCIVILTAYSSVATAVEAMKLGADDYLIKPVLTDDILSSFNLIKKQSKSIPEVKPPSPKRVEWEHIQRILKENNFNITLTAKALNMHRRTLQRKLQKKPVKS